jgi:hypothetical protein
MMFRFDVREREFPKPLTVMFAPTVKSLDASVAIKETGPTALMAADCVIEKPETLTLPELTIPSSETAPPASIVNCLEAAVRPPRVVAPEDMRLISTPALICPEPVLMVEDALLITTFSVALIVAAVLVNAPEAPVAKNDTLLVDDVTAALTVCAPPRYVTELVAWIGPPTVNALSFDVDPTTRAPTEVVEPAVGKVTDSAKGWFKNGDMERVPTVRMFRARFPAAFANRFPSNEMSPDDAPPEPIFVSPDPNVLKIAPRLPRKVIRPVVAETVVLLMSNEYVAAPVPEELPSK